MPVYNKLVRDKIPKIIRQDGKEFTSRILSDDEYHQELINKLDEELTELMKAKNRQDRLEELADMLELIHYLSSENGCTIEELDKLRESKKEKRGGFDDRIFLVEVED